MFAHEHRPEMLLDAGVGMPRRNLVHPRWSQPRDGVPRHLLFSRDNIVAADRLSGAAPADRRAGAGTAPGGTRRSKAIVECFEPAARISNDSISTWHIVFSCPPSRAVRSEP